MDRNIQTVAAGLSQYLIMDISNDVMQFGLECFASKGIHGLDIEFQNGEKSDRGNLTRHLENAEHLVYNLSGLVPMLLNHIVNG